MGRQTAGVLYALAMVAVIVGVDVLFFRHHAWLRLIVNVGIVMVFAAFYLRFLRLRRDHRPLLRRPALIHAPIAATSANTAASRPCLMWCCPLPA